MHPCHPLWSNPDTYQGSWCQQPYAGCTEMYIVAADRLNLLACCALVLASVMQALTRTEQEAHMMREHDSSKTQATSRQISLAVRESGCHLGASLCGTATAAAASDIIC